MRKKVSLMCFFAARSRSRGVFGPLGPSSKVIAIYGPSTLTREKVILAVVGAVVRVTGGAAGVAVGAAAAAGVADGDGAGEAPGVCAPASAMAKRKRKKNAKRDMDTGRMRNCTLRRRKGNAMPG